MNSALRPVAVGLLLLAATAFGGDEPPTLRFGWPLPTRVGVTETLGEGDVRVHYVLDVRRDEAAKLRVRCGELHVVELGGRSADNPLIAFQAALTESLLAATRCDVVLDDDARPVAAPEAVRHFKSALDALAKSEDAELERLAVAMRSKAETNLSGDVGAAAASGAAMSAWRWTVGAWVGLPLRAGTVFEGDLEIASEIGDVVPSPMHAEITAKPVDGTDGHWRLSLNASSDGDRAKAALSHGGMSKATSAKRTVEVTAEVDAATLRPFRVSYRETLEAAMPDEPLPRRSAKSRVLEFEWDPPKPVKPELREARDRALDEAASACLEAERLGRGDDLKKLLSPLARAGSERLDPWPSSWTWTAFRRRAEGDWGLVAVFLKCDRGTLVWPLLLHWETGAWRVVGEGFGPLETGLLLIGQDKAATRWIGPQFEDWTLEALTANPAEEVRLGEEPRGIDLADGRSCNLWFRVTAGHTVEFCATSPVDVGLEAEVVALPGRSSGTSCGKRRWIALLEPRSDGSGVVTVGVEKAIRVTVRLRELTPAVLDLGKPFGPTTVRAESPLRLRLRLAAPRPMVFRAVRVTGGSLSNLFLGTETDTGSRSSSDGIERCDGASDVLVSVSADDESDTECFVLAEDPEAASADGAALHPGESREIELPAGGATLVRVNAPAAATWTATFDASDATAIACGDYRDERGGGVIVASRGAAVRVTLRIAAAK